MNPELYNKSAESYKKSSEKMKKMLELGAKIDSNELKSLSTKDLSLEEALSNVKTIEQTKTEHALQATIALMMKKITRD